MNVCVAAVDGLPGVGMRPVNDVGGLELRGVPLTSAPQRRPHSPTVCFSLTHTQTLTLSHTHTHTLTHTHTHTHSHTHTLYSELHIANTPIYQTDRYRFKCSSTGQRTPPLPTHTHTHTQTHTPLRFY